jgi:hypothetical protein
MALTLNLIVFNVLCTALLPRVEAGQRPADAAPIVKKLDAQTYAIGQLRVDTVKREVSAPAVTNDARVLEFVANTKGGFKAYESLLTVDTDAVSFNAALLLIGLDPKHARVPEAHFDPLPPAGDTVDIFVEWTAGTEHRRMRVEQLLLDLRTRQGLPEGPWVYTGSTFIDGVEGRRYLADLDGVLIGFVHSPAPIIENPRAGAVNRYGSVVFNRDLGLTPGMGVTLVVRALSPKA